jgi:hypothetical protein
MAESSLHNILNTLPATDLRALDKFMESPYHVQHEEVRALYRHIRTKIREKKTAMPGLTDLAVILGIPLKKVPHIQSYLLEAIEEFLAQEQWREHPAERHLLTVEQLRKLRLNGESAAMLRYARKRVDACPERGSAYHRLQYRLHLEDYALTLQQGRARAFNLQELSDAQDVAFICEKLRTGCMLLSHQAVRQQPYDAGLLAPVLDFLQNHPYLTIPAVAVYYHGYYAQQGGEGSAYHFTRLKALLSEHPERWSPAELHDLYLMAVNYCIRRINQGEEAYYRSIFELYQTGLSAGALMEDGVLSRWTYNNVALTALSLKEFDWAWRFLHDYAAYLQEEHQEAAFHYNLARYYFEKSDLKAAMRHLLHMEYDDVLQNLVAKVMLCKIYYLLDEMDALENQLDSIQIYIRRKKVLGYHKENYRAIVRFIRKMIAVQPNDAAQKNALRQQIADAPVLTEREWLLQQLE